MTISRWLGIRGVVSDLDGTLLRSDGTLSPATMSMLDAARTAGVPFVVATGRTPRAVRRIVGYEHLGRMVCANGAVVWDAEGDEVVREACFNPAALAAAVARLRSQLPEAGCALLSASKMFLDSRYARLRRKGSAGAELFTVVDRVVAAHRIVTVAVRDPRRSAEELMTPVGTAFAHVGVAACAGLETVDVAPGATTKAAAVADEMARAGCPADATAVFGDMPNDLPLFAWSGWACAVANGHPRVLEAADEIVPSNDEDGVARTLPWAGQSSNG